MELAAFQDLISRTYAERDRSRGIEATVAWLCEELGELARAVRKGTADEQRHEISDVLAWLASLTDQLGLSLEDAAQRYAGGCPRCSSIPCACPQRLEGSRGVALGLEVQDDLLSRLLGGDRGGVDDPLGVGRLLVRIGDPGELLHQTGPCLGVEPLAVAALADLDGRGDVDEDEPATGFDHGPHVA